jgi:hypothetical protein
MVNKPKIGDIVKLHVAVNSKLTPVIGKVIGINENIAWIEYNNEIYTRAWTGLTEATQEEIVLWRFEQ